MTRPVILTAHAFLNESGFGNHRFFKPWTNADEARSFRWSRISEQPFDRFGRLDPLCRGAVAVVEMLGLQPPDDGAPMGNVALLLGTSTGSLAVDISFCRTIGQPGGASPMLFSYTLPSTAIGEIAIRHRIGGPNVCLNAGPESALLALWEGVRWIEEGEADIALCVACEAEAVPPNSPLRAAAFLVQNAEYRGHHPMAPLAVLRFCAAGELPVGAHLDASPTEAMSRLGAPAGSSGPNASELVYLRRPSVLRDSARAFALVGDSHSAGSTP